MLSPIWTLLLLSISAVKCEESFDYVIVGGGTSGLVLANRLSEDPAVSVAVIEPGPDVRDYFNVSRIDLQGLDYINASIDWAYTSVPQSGIANRSLLYHAGKAIGGTSNINGMVYLRGDEAQFNTWEKLGNEGWNWDNLFPYYIRSENFTIPSPEQIAAGVTYEEDVHGRDGFLVTGFPNGLDNSSFYSDYRDAWNELSVPHNPDLLRGTTEGFAMHPQTLDRDAAVRETAARAYYLPVEDRPNLKVIQGTVSKILWGASEDDEVVASGVEYRTAPGNVSMTVTVAKEVIVSAGALRSPLVLEASGIGGSDILSAHGIDVKVDLPGVGEGMQDQQLVGLTYLTSQDITGYHPYITFLSAKDLFGNETSATAEATDAKIATWAQIVSDASNGALSPENLETRFRTQHDLIFKENVTLVETSPYIAGGVIAAVVWTLMPFSWGSVHLSTSSAADYPVIDSQFISVDFDVDVLTAAGRLSQQLYGTAPLSEWIAGLVEGGGPAPGSPDEDWKEHILGTATTCYHEVGTCVMLPRELGGVVDSSLKVYGTRNVRVVDASVIPVQMSGNPTGTLYAMSERAADIIKAQGGCEEA
ncbi:hypothetical protein E8E14_001789 [Neopestalotiopsis sp. 37M]|nr:hypothetical protein E8E14_001789 [Neopestalotiopsis sp. 37M]